MIVMQASTARLYPSRAQAERMARLGGQCRALWNHWLAENAARYERDGTFAFYAEMSASLPALRRQERFEGLLHRCAQMTVRKLDRALRDCGKSAASRKGFPRFKSRHARSDAFQFAGREVRVEPGRVKLPALGWVRCRGLCVPDGAKLFQATVRQAPCASGWEFSLQFEGPPPVAAPGPPRPAIGIDVGLADLVVTSDGQRVAPPRLRTAFLKRQRRLNRERDRRRKGSVNRRRTVARLARVHRKVANARADHFHKATRALVDAHAGFAVEDLCLKGMARTRLAGSIHDAALGGFRRMLAYKAAWAGRTMHEYPRFARSTGVCPACGLVGLRLPLSIRRWDCQGCGVEHDRDVAAAQVILLGAVGRGTPEPGPATARKRGSADGGGGQALAGPSRVGPPANAAVGSCHEVMPCASTQ